MLDNEVVIDISDWMEADKDAELEFANSRDAYRVGAETKRTAREMSQFYFVRQRAGAVEEQVFDPTAKTELAEGIYQRFRRVSPLDELIRKSHDSSGQEHETVLARYKAYPADGNDGLVDGDSENGTRAARNYLQNQCIGHIRRALARLVANDCGAIDEAKAFCETVMRVAEELDE